MIALKALMEKKRMLLNCLIIQRSRPILELIFSLGSKRAIKQKEEFLGLSVILILNGFALANPDENCYHCGR